MHKGKKRSTGAGRFFAYVVECRDGTYYTGYTPDLESRIKTHNSGRGAKYTRSRRPVHLIWSRAFKSFRGAVREEARIKALTRSKKEELVCRPVTKRSKR